jgi:hypothetical protein
VAEDRFAFPGDPVGNAILRIMAIAKKLIFT